MSSQQAEAGKVWATQLIRDLAEQFDLVVESIEWLPQGRDSLAPAYWGVEVETQMGTNCERFSVKDLEDYETARVRMSLHYRAKMLLLGLSRDPQ